jgi:deazaflavin-dependent oxidoreductase (nitroreductase family)
MAVKRGPFLKFFWWYHKLLLRLSGGRAFDRIGKLRVLLLHTTGRRSGQPRVTALSYVPHGSSFAVVASNAGANFEPAWWLNLQSQPEAEVQVRGKKLSVKSRLAAAEEAAAIYAKFVEADKSYAEYKQRTTRPISVVVLDP